MEDPRTAAAPLPFFLIVFTLILLSGFFALFNAALGACRKPRLQKEAAGGAKGMKRLLEASENPGFSLLSCRIWSVIFRTTAAFLTGCYVMRYTMPLVVVSAPALALAVILLGDIIPRLCARVSPERIAAALLPLVTVFTLPLRPFGFIARRIDSFFRTALQLEDRGSGMTEDELHLALMEGEKSGIVESRERDMVEGVFYLGDRPAGAFMTHRSEIQWLDVNAPPEEIRAKALQYREQRCYPVADGAPDEIIGAVYLEDIILNFDGKTLRAIMKKPPFIPETMPALKAFESFKRSEADFLFVMDEYGGFAGIISVRDLVEEIVGELAAPRQEEETLVRQEDGTWLAGGSLNIDDAAELLALPGLAARHDDYHTLAGFVLSLAGELPRPGDTFTCQGFRFKVIDMDGNRINRLLISRESGSL